MPRASGSSPNLRFREPQNFTFLDDLNLWCCNVCTNPQLKHQSAVSLKAAMKHERGGPHAKRVRASKEDAERWKPQPGIQAWLQVPDYDDLFERRGDEQMRRVDSLKEFIPFWQRQVEAADRGEELRLEAFLDALDAGRANDPWNSNWDTPTPAWAADVEQDNNPWNVGPSGWAVDDAEAKSSDTAHWRRSEGVSNDDDESSAEGSRGEDPQALDAYTFVEEVARLESISGDRKQGLHDFYKCPTHVKLTRIQDLIVTLKGMGGN